MKQTNLPVENAVDLPGLMEFLFRAFSMQLEFCMPAVVVQYDRNSNIVQCQGALNMKKVDGSSQERQIIKLPCFNPYGLHVGINFPLSPGDTGWIIAADRDSAFFKQMLSKVDPQSADVHQYAFGYFVPDKVKDMTILPEDTGALVIGALDGSTKIHVRPSDILISTGTAKIDVDMGGGITLTGDSVRVNGTMTVSTGASGIISLNSVAIVTNGIVTAIS